MLWNTTPDRMCQADHASLSSSNIVPRWDAPAEERANVCPVRLIDPRCLLLPRGHRPRRVQDKVEGGVKTLHQF